MLTLLPKALVKDCPQFGKIIPGQFVFVYKVGNQRGERAAGQPGGKGFQLAARVSLATDGSREKMNAQTAVTVNISLVFQPLEQPLDGAMLGFGFIGIKFLSYLTGGHSVLLPQQVHDGEFGVCQWLSLHCPTPFLERFLRLAVV
jgi:hypothetical protein